MPLTLKGGSSPFIERHATPPRHGSRAASLPEVVLEQRVSTQRARMGELLSRTIHPWLPINAPAGPGLRRAGAAPRAPRPAAAPSPARTRTPPALAG